MQDTFMPQIKKVCIFLYTSWLSRFFKPLFIFCRAHAGALFLSLFIGMITIAPQLIFQSTLGERYQGIYLGGTDNEDYYAGRVREAFDGHYAIGNAFLYEGRDALFLQPPLGELLFLPLGALFSFNPVTTLFWGSRFVFPLLLTFIIYYFIYLLFSSKLLALAVSSSIVLASQFVYFPKQLFNLIPTQFGAFSIDSFLTYSRPVLPQTSTLFFFLFLLLFFLLLNKRTMVWHCYPIGILYGLSIYLYLYNWIFLTVFCIIIIGFYVWWKDKEMVKALMRFFFCGIIITLPFWFVMLKNANSPFWVETAARYNIYGSHDFVFSKLLAISLIGWLAANYRKLKDPAVHLILALILSGFVVINQQIITGRVLFYGHFHWYFNVPIFIIAMLYLAHMLSVRVAPLLNKIMVIIILSVSIGSATMIQAKSLETRAQGYMAQQDWGGVYLWLDKNLPLESVILSNNRSFSNAIPTYTKHYPYDGIYAHLFLADPERLKYNIFIYLWLRGLKADKAGEYFSHTPHEIIGYLGAARVRRVYGCTVCVPADILHGFADEYVRFIEQRRYEQLAQYKLDIFAWDRREDGAVPEYLLTRFTFVTRVNNFDIYRIH
ncbi:MAG: hypothetical protein WC659_00700 [Patescibacteria group bacterium]